MIIMIIILHSFMDFFFKIIHLLFIACHIQLAISAAASASTSLTSNQNQAVAPIMPDIKISIVYSPTEYYNVSELESVMIYQNQQSNQSFIYDDLQFSCANTDIFVLNQTSFNQEYFLLIQDYNKNLKVQINILYDTVGPKPMNYSCDILYNLCNITLKTFCNPEYGFNIVTVTILTEDSSQLITQFEYNSVCNQELYQYYFQIQWGTAIIVIASVLIIFVCSKFQQARSYNNVVFYVNYYVIGGYSVLSLVNFLLVVYNVAGFQQVLYCILVVLSFVIGSLSTMLCFSQFVFFTKIKFMRIGYESGRIKLRIMDFIGFGLGIGLLLSWYFTNKNWIISDIIFMFIFLAMIKIIKFGSLKLSLIFFVCTLVIDLGFGQTIQIMNSTYTNSSFYAFNNPLFIMIPMLAKIPNRKCAWHFIPSIAYPGLLLSYLQRFDKNRGSMIYSITFMFCYVLCSILWFIVNYFVPIALPYDLFTVPIAMVLLVLFANRRGELNDLWLGTFYDQQKSYYENQLQILEKLQVQKTVSYNINLFKNLKYDNEHSQYGSSKGSKFSQIIKSISLRPRIEQNHFSYQHKPTKNTKQTKQKNQKQQVSLSVRRDMSQRIQKQSEISQGQNTQKSIITDKQTNK